MPSLNFLKKLKINKEIAVLLALLFLLILPRALTYFVLGPGLVSTDAETRYFFQMEELKESWVNFFHQTGPLYSLFLLFCQKIFNNIVAGPIFIHHLIGIISALLVFYYFKKINLFLTFIVTVFSFSNPVSLWLEHSLLRETLTSFFLIILVILLTSAVKKEKYFKLGWAFLSGLIGLGLIFLRVEFLVLVVLIPLILLIVRKRNEPKLKLRDKRFLKWSFGYLIPFFILFVIYSSAPQKPEIGTTYKSYFNIAFHSLQPDVFYYQDSRYPELLRGYQKIIEEKKTVTASMSGFYQETGKYLENHPEINLAVLDLMDKVYLEIINKNSLSYQKSVVINLKNHLLGTKELKTMINRPRLTDNEKIDKIIKFSSKLMIIISWIVFLLFLPALAFFFIKWKLKSLPVKVIISFLIGAVHIMVLTFLADPAHRFRYAIDPFVYFSQFYLIMALISWLALKIKTISFKIKI